MIFNRENLLHFNYKSRYVSIAFIFTNENLIKISTKKEKVTNPMYEYKYVRKYALVIPVYGKSQIKILPEPDRWIMINYFGGFCVTLVIFNYINPQDCYL